MSKVGIAIPFYSHTSYLCELLTSLFSQSCPEWRAYVIDDSGTELLSPAFRRQFDDQRITFRHHSVNQGSVQTWNEGIKHLLEDPALSVISVVHADDRLGKDYVKDVLQAFAKHPEVDVYHVKTKIIDANGDPSWFLADAYKSVFRKRVLKDDFYLSAGDNGLAQILKRNFVYCPALVFNRSRFRAISFDDKWQMVADLELVSRMLLNNQAILSLPNVSYFYRRHTKNLSLLLTSSTTRFAEEIELYDQLEVACAVRGFSSSAHEARKKTSIKLHLLYRIFVQAVRLNLKDIVILIRLLKTCW